MQTLIGRCCAGDRQRVRESFLWHMVGFSATRCRPLTWTIEVGLLTRRWSHVNVSLTLTNQLFKNIKQVILFIFQEDKHKTTRCKHHCTQLQPVLDVITQKVQVEATGEWFAWKIWRQFLYWAPLSWPSVYLRSKELACFCRSKKNGHSSAVKKATAQSNVQSNSRTFTNIAIAFFLQTSDIQWNTSIILADRVEPRS